MAHRLEANRKERCLLCARSRCRASHERIVTITTISGRSPKAPNDSLGETRELNPESGVRLALNQEAVKDKCCNLSYHNRNVPGFSTIEMSPGYGFTMPKKISEFSCFGSDSFSMDDQPQGCTILVLGMGARGKGQRLFPRSAL